MAKIALLIPACNEGDGLRLAVEAVERQLGFLGCDFEFILVDDGSQDGTWQVIQELAAERANVVGLGLSRNFGKENAVIAGLDACDADCVIVMDADLQHPPNVLPEMIQKWAVEGYAVVHGVKAQRQGESRFRRICSRLFFWGAQALTGFDLRDASDFKLLDRQVVERCRDLPEHGPFFRGLVEWLGFPSARVYFDVAERAHGRGKWTAWQLACYACGSVLSFSALPLKLVTVMGLAFFLLSLGTGCKLFVDWLRDASAQGFPTTPLLVVAFANFITASICVLSWYMSRIYEEVKRRPRFVVSRSIHGIASRLPSTTHRVTAGKR